MYFIFLCFYKNEINITNEKKKKNNQLQELENYFQMSKFQLASQQKFLQVRSNKLLIEQESESFKSETKKSSCEDLSKIENYHKRYQKFIDEYSKPLVRNMYSYVISMVTEGSKEGH